MVLQAKLLVRDKTLSPLDVADLMKRISLDTSKRLKLVNYTPDATEYKELVRNLEESYAV